MKRSFPYLVEFVIDTYETDTDGTGRPPQIHTNTDRLIDNFRGAVGQSAALMLRDANRVATPPRQIASGVAILFVRRARQTHRLARRAVIRSLAARDFAERKLNNMKDESAASYARIEEVLGDTIYANILDDAFQYPDLSNRYGHLFFFALWCTHRGGWRVGWRRYLYHRNYSPYTIKW